MKNNLLISAFLILTATVSCTYDRNEVGRQAIPYVSDILSGDVPGRELLQNASVIGRNGMIYVYGDAAICRCVCDSLVAMDRFDNASGAYRYDLLPDFAGETIVSVADSSCAGASGMIQRGDTAGVRRLAVNILLSALDTSCYLSRFDNVGLGRKTPAKQLILLDPAFSVSGKYDIDTLLQASSCNLEVLIPVECAFSDLISEGGSFKRVAVMSPFGPGSYPCYPDIFSDVCRNMPDASDCGITFCDTVSTLHEFLDSYILAGRSEPLDAIVVDCCTADVHELYREFVRMNDVMHEDFSRYGQLFSADFRLVSALHSVIERSHSDIRKRNLFTHRISAPAMEHYCSAAGFDDNSSIRIIECSR